MMEKWGITKPIENEVIEKPRKIEVIEQYIGSKRREDSVGEIIKIAEINQEIKIVKQSVVEVEEKVEDSIGVKIELKESIAKRIKDCRTRGEEAYQKFMDYHKKICGEKGEIIKEVKESVVEEHTYKENAEIESAKETIKKELENLKTSDTKLKETQIEEIIAEKVEKELKGIYTRIKQECMRSLGPARSKFRDKSVSKGKNRSLYRSRGHWKRKNRVGKRKKRSMTLSNIYKRITGYLLHMRDYSFIPVLRGSEEFVLNFRNMEKEWKDKFRKIGQCFEQLDRKREPPDH